MKKSINKIIIIIVALLSLILLASCEEINSYEGNEYKIFYVDNGTVLDLEPSSYIAGEHVDLPTYDKVGFAGWYDNKNFEGDAIVAVTKDYYGNLVFYAKIEEARFNITYMYGETEIDGLTPATYKAGAITILPSYSLTGYSFGGWYLRSDLSGTAISQIGSKQSGDITLYCKMIKTESLADYISTPTSFSYNYSYKSSYSDTYSVNVKYNNGLWYFLDNDEVEVYYSTLDETFYYTEDGSEYQVYNKDTDSEDYEGLLNTVPLFTFDRINPDNYTYKNGQFTCNNDLANEVANIYGDLDEDYSVSSLKISVKDNKISKISFSITISSFFSSTKYSVSYTFDYDEVSLSLPEIKDPVATGIEASNSLVNVKLGSSKDDALNGVSIYVVYDNGKKKVLDSSEYTVSESVDMNTLGSYTVTVTYGEFTCTYKIDVLENVGPVIDDDVLVLEDVIKTLGEDEGTVYGLTRGLSENSKILIIPVEFTDYTFSSNARTVMEKAFFGTSAETGWESLKSYYYKSSYGKVNLTGTVLETYKANMKSTTFNSQYESDCNDHNYDNDEDTICELIKSILEYYDSKIDYSEYDTDKDGYIDSLYLVYSCPYNQYSDSSIFWAFSSEYYTDDAEYYDNVEGDFYTFLSYDFFEDDLSNGDKVAINCETIIHESGHLFGLTDYYDYYENEGPDGGIGGSDMMDYNVGDHNAFSKAILGWISPSVLVASNTVDTTVTLNPYATSGDALIVCANWNSTYFDEYYIIDYYTPTGLYEKEAGTNGLFTVAGIRIYHINAGLKTASEAWQVWDMYESDNSETTNKLIKLIQADGKGDIERKGASSDNGDLFKAGTSYSSFTLYGGTNMNLTLTVNSLGDTASITIKYSK